MYIINKYIKTTSYIPLLSFTDILKNSTPFDQSFETWLTQATSHFSFSMDYNAQQHRLTELSSPLWLSPPPHCNPDSHVHVDPVLCLYLESINPRNLRIQCLPFDIPLGLPPYHPHFPLAYSTTWLNSLPIGPSIYPGVSPVLLDLSIKRRIMGVTGSVISLILLLWEGSHHFQVHQLNYCRWNSQTQCPPHLESPFTPLCSGWL